MNGPVNHKHLGFTGTKERVTEPQLKSLALVLAKLRDKGFLWMHNGDCVEADEKAAKIWRSLKGKIYLHPPIKPDFRAYVKADITCEPRDYLVRDRHIAESCHTLVATPLTATEQTRSGTWATVRYARKLRRRVWIIQPSGRIVWSEA